MHTHTMFITLLAAISLLPTKTCAHSWVEQMQVISDNGSFTGNMGYIRGYMARTDFGYNGNSMDYLVPALDTDRTRINASDLLCHPSQRTSNYTNTYPMIQVNSGGYVALKYLENGHVTLPQNQLGKPKAAGTIFIFGTTQPKDDEKIVDVLMWTQDGHGGDGRGSLLSAQNFDDNRCHQINSGTISIQRQQQFPDRVPDQPTSNVEQWCETDLQIPTTAASDTRMTLYWIWQWPTAPGADPTYPDGKDEYYTSCADVEIIADAVSAGLKPTSSLLQQDPQTQACTDWRSRTALTTTPFVSTASASGVSSTVSSSTTDSSSTSTTTQSTLSAPTSTSSISTTVTVTISVNLTVTSTISMRSSRAATTSSGFTTLPSIVVPSTPLPDRGQGFIADTPSVGSGGLIGEQRGMLRQ